METLSEVKRARKLSRYYKRKPWQTYRDAFYSPVNVGNSLFVLYNGKMVTEPNYNILCKELFVIGWDGSLECHYTLDQGVSSIAVDNQKRKIYGISDDPEYHIVVFDY